MQGHVLEQPPAAVTDVTDADFEQTVIEESKRRPVVVDLWAEWCGPCKTLGPILEKVAKAHDGDFLLAKLDVDANPMVAGALGVQSIPTVVAFKDGQPVDGFVGAYPEAEVQRFVGTLLPSDADIRTERAEEEAEAGDVPGAEEDFRTAIVEDPDNQAARVGLARLLVDRGDLDEAETIVTPLLPDPEAEAVASRIRVGRWGAGNADAGGPLGEAKSLAAAGEWRPALEAMLALAPSDESARAAMLDVFATLDDDDALVAEFRRRLASALF